MFDPATFGGSTSREVLRAWLGEHLPGNWRQRQRDGGEAAFVEFQHAWFEQLKSVGLLVPHWPVECGGGGFSADQQAVLHTELAAAGAPRLQLHFVSLYHTAATLLRFGDDAQRTRWLGGILDGDVWCQGFSEPDAGSDLGSLRTRAVAVDGGFLVTGQKVWTSIGTEAQWCLLLARTGEEGSRTRGITLFAMAMDSPGLTVRTIRQSTGVDEFCELFLDGVFISSECVIGKVGEGWAAAHATLITERGLTTLELTARLSSAVEWAERDFAAGRLIGTDPLSTALTLGQVRAEVDGVMAFAQQFLERATHGEAHVAEASALKLLYSDVLQRSLDRLAQIAGLESYRDGELLQGAGWETGHWALDFINAGSWTIAGGASEVLRDVIAEQLLGLPRRVTRA